MTDKKQKIFLILMLPFLLGLTCCAAIFIANNICNFTNYSYDTISLAIGIVVNVFNIIGYLLLALYALVPAMRKKLLPIAFVALRIIALVAPQVNFMLGGGADYVIASLITIVVDIIPLIFILLSILVKNKVVRYINLAVQVIFFVLCIISSISVIATQFNNFIYLEFIGRLSAIANVIAIFLTPIVFILFSVSQLFADGISNKKAVPAYNASYAPGYNPAFNNGAYARPVQQPQAYPYPQQRPQPAPQPVPQAQTESPESELDSLHKMYVSGIITEEEFSSKKAEILAKM